MALRVCRVRRRVPKAFCARLSRPVKRAVHYGGLRDAVLASPVMLKTSGYAAPSARAPLQPFSFERRDVGPRDVLIDIRYCGICHSDLHQARDEWGGAAFPMVPGHEVVGVVAKIGKKVKKFRVGQAVGVGCFVDSCRKCHYCKMSEQQFCENHVSFTYNSTEQDRLTPTFGGYSKQMVVDENYVLRIPPGIPLQRAAPLLCAGITTYAPLRQWGVGKGTRLGVLGLGGLGHMAVKIGAALGAEVTVFSRSEEKKKDAKRLGAARFLVTANAKAFEDHQQYFETIIDTVSAKRPVDPYFELLKTDGTYILVGVPEHPLELKAMPLISRRRKLVGSLIGGIAQTQEMLNFCARKKLAADVEVIAMREVNAAYERLLKGDVRYRFVLDLATL